MPNTPVSQPVSNNEEMTVKYEGPKAQEDLYRAIGSIQRTHGKDTPQLGYHRSNAFQGNEGKLTPGQRKLYNVAMPGLEAMWARDCAREALAPLPGKRVTQPVNYPFSKVLPKGWRPSYRPWNAPKSRLFSGILGGGVSVPAFAFEANDYAHRAADPRNPLWQRAAVHAPMAALNGASALGAVAEVLAPRALRWGPRLMGTTGLADLVLGQGRMAADTMERGTAAIEAQNKDHNEQQDAFLGLLQGKESKDSRKGLPPGAVRAFKYSPLQKAMYSAGTWFRKHGPGTVNASPDDRENLDTARAFGKPGFWHFMAPGANQTLQAVRRRNAESRLREFDQDAYETEPKLHMSPEAREKTVYVPAQASGRLVPIKAGELYDQYVAMLKKQYQAELPVSGSGYVGNSMNAGYLYPKGENELMKNLPQEVLPQDPVYQSMQKYYDQYVQTYHEAPPRELTEEMEDIKGPDKAEMAALWNQVCDRRPQELRELRDARAEKARRPLFKVPLRTPEEEKLYAAMQMDQGYNPSHYRDGLPMADMGAEGAMRLNRSFLPPEYQQGPQREWAEKKILEWINWKRDPNRLAREEMVNNLGYPGLGVR